MYRRSIHAAAAALGALAILLGIIGARPVAAAPAQREPWVTYTAADGRWSIAYPRDVLSPEDLGNGTVVFISRDRSAFVAIDSYSAAGKAAPADLRARARRALTRIYGAAPRTIQQLDQLDAPWQAGVRFATAKGSEGVAVYLADGPAASAWGTGMLYGYKAKGPAALREDLYQTMARFQRASSPGGSADRPSVDMMDRQAREKVAGFLLLLSGAKYRQAAALFGGDYQPLRDMNPDLAGGVAGNEQLQEQLLQRACAANGYACLRQRRVLDVKVYSPDEAVVTVELSNRDGSRFAAGGRTAFEFRVARVGGQYFVMSLPPYRS
jgi:hypothetical protein